MNIRAFTHCDAFQRISKVLPSVEKIQSVLPTKETVIKVGLVALHIFVTATFTIVFPATSIVVGVVLTVTVIAFRQINKERIFRQEKDGLDFEASQRAFGSMREVLKIKKLLWRDNLVRIITLVAISQIGPVGIICSIAFMSWDWITSSIEEVSIKESQKVFKETFLSQKELHAIERLYPQYFNAANPADEDSNLENRVKLLEEESEGRRCKKKYLNKLQGHISDAWQGLLKSKTLTLQQGFDSDWEIFQPICNLAVVEELKKELSLDEHKCPPSLRGRAANLKAAKEMFKKLSDEQKVSLYKKLATPDVNIAGELMPLFHKVTQIAGPMMQEQELFQKAIQNGSSMHCLRTFQVKVFGQIQWERLKEYKNRLFFADTKPTTKA